MKIVGRLIHIRGICVLQAVVCLLMLGLCSAPAGAAEQLSANKFFEMSLEELMNIPVVAVSRQPIRMQNLSAPTTILTTEDIHYSGVTSIPELLQFVPGVDVRRLDRRRTVVGVHGSMGFYSDRTLVLIDGRSVPEPVLGTTHWENLPVMAEDIERIEVVRGTGGAAWGVNALNGVINIITKKPGKDLQNLFSTTVTEYGDTSSFLRYGQSHEDLSWKISTGYENNVDSDAAGAGKFYSSNSALNPLIGFDNYSARDWGRVWKFDAQGLYRIDAQTQLSFGAAYSYGQEGDFEFVGYFPRRDYLTSYTRLFARLQHEFDNDANWYIQWFGNFWDTHRLNITEKMASFENSVEAQLNFKPLPSHDVSVGGSIRFNRMTVEGDTGGLPQALYAGEEFNEHWLGGFLIDRWSISDRLNLEGQLRLDYYNITGTDWSTRLAAIYALDDLDKHVVRFGFTRAFRSPDISMRKSYGSYAGGLFTMRQPVHPMDNENSYSLEGGYLARLTDTLSFNVDTYYQRYERMMGATNETFGPVTQSTFGNIDGATGYGGECSLTWRDSAGKVSLWYAYNGFSPDQPGQVIRALYPANHKAGLTGRLHIDKQWTVSAMYAYQNSISMDGAAAIDAETSNRLDLTLSRSFANDRGEWMIGVSDALNNTAALAGDVSNLTLMELPGRTFFVRVQITF